MAANSSNPERAEEHMVRGTGSKDYGDLSVRFFRLTCLWLFITLTAYMLTRYLTQYIVLPIRSTYLKDIPL